MKSKKSTTVKQAPLSGPFDARSKPEQIPKDGWRLVQNISLDNMEGKLCRAQGWQKLLSGAVTNRAYNNEDLHDQLLSLQTYYDVIEGADDSTVMAYPPHNADFATTCGTTLKTRTQGRQPITLLEQIESSSGNRRLAAGTQSRLYILNERRGNWRIIGDGFGGTASDPSVRWRQVRLGDYVLFTNNYDEPVYWPFDGPMTGCQMQAVQKIPDFQTIAISKVAVMFEFRNIIIAANIEEDNQRKGNMVRWSDFGAPLSWIEDPGVSVAGHQELDYGEEIIAGGVIGDFGYLYTNRGVWKISVSNDPATVFVINKVYSSDTGADCIKYPFSFVSIGEAHFYMAQDGIYNWSPYSPRPERLVWIHRASAILYERLNKSNCAIHTAGFDPIRKELYFSCALVGDALPSVTLCCNTEYKHAFKIDHGFPTFASFVPDDRPNVFDWLVENCIISQACLESDASLALGAVDLKQGPAMPITTPPCETFATSFCKDPPSFGPNLMEGSYSVESTIDYIGLDTSKRYKWTPGANEDTFYNGHPFDEGFQTYTETTIFTPVTGAGFVTGTCGSCPFTGTLQEQLTDGAQTCDGDVCIEDANGGQNCDATSICAIMGGKAIPELCRKCEGATIFIAASSTDWCIKQFGDVYYREMRVNDAYVNQGYQSRLVKTLPGNSHLVALSFVSLQYNAEPQSPALNMNLRTGGSLRAEDPLQACDIQWSDEGGRPIDCQENDKGLEWAVWTSKNFLYLDFTIDGVGGACCLQSLEITLQPAC